MQTINSINVFIKKDHLVLKIKDSADHDSVMRELKTKLSDIKEFYKTNSGVPILVTGKVLKTDEMKEIQERLLKSLKVDIEFESPKELGLHGIKKDFKKEIESSETKFLRKSLRSGQKVEFEGSVVILGDVNDGAEVIAEDNIIVLGALRGMAHAGAKGNEEAIIAARLIDSPQIRIASHIKERTREQIDMDAVAYAYVNEDGEIEME